MRIGIDARRLSGRPTGVGIYLRNLVRCFQNQNYRHEYRLFYAQLEDLKYSSRLGSWLMPLWVDFLHKQLAMPIILETVNIDLFFAPTPPLPIMARCPTVVTIHDVAPPGYANWISRFYRDAVTPITAHKATRVMTDSEFSKRAIIRWVGINPRKVVVVPLSVCGDQFRPLGAAQAISEVRERFGIGDRMILSVIGSLSPHKNVEALIEAYAGLRPPFRPRWRLAIVGDTHGLEDLRKRLANTIAPEVWDTIIFTGYVEDADLLALYNAADLFVFPSLHEGFGLPVLEAMACGIPVLASNRASIPEVVGDAGLLADPGNIAELSQKITMLLEDEHLRNELRAKGLVRAKEFSPDKMCREILRVFEEAVCGSNC